MCVLVAHALHYSATTAGKIVNACCILTNMARALLPPDEVYAEALRLQKVCDLYSTILECNEVGILNNMQ